MKETPTPTDEELVSQFKSGNESAFDAIVHRHADAVARIVARLVAREQDVPDVVQDALVDVLAGIKRWRGEATLRTWIISVTIRRCRRHRRYAWTRRLWTTNSASAPEAIECDGPSSGHHLEREENAAIVRAMVSQLPAKLREVTVLRYFEQLEIAEVAQAVGISRAAVDMRLTRARAILRQKLEQQLSTRSHD